MSRELLIIIPLLIGFSLDTIFGDPLWLPHPIRLFGNSIAYFTGKLNCGTGRKQKGVAMAISLIAATFWSFWLIMKLAGSNEILFIGLASLGIFNGLANRSLISEAHKVFVALEKKWIGSWAEAIEQHCWP